MSKNFVDNSNATALIGAVEESIANTRIFKGTFAEWDELTPEEKAKYKYIATPDIPGGDIADAVTDGDMRPVTSNAVFKVADEIYSKFDRKFLIVATNFGTFQLPEGWDTDYRFIYILMRYNNDSYYLQPIMLPTYSLGKGKPYVASYTDGTSVMVAKFVISAADELTLLMHADTSRLVTGCYFCLVS